MQYQAQARGHYYYWGKSDKRTEPWHVPGNVFKFLRDGHVCGVGDQRAYPNYADAIADLQQALKKAD